MVQRRHTVPRVLLALLSASVLLVTGVGWSFYRDLAGGISTTDVIFGGSSEDDGEAMNILLVGVDSRTDAQGNPLSDEVLAQLNSAAEPGVLNSDTIILLHVPEDGSGATAFSIPRDSYVRIPGYGKSKINSAYPATKSTVADELREQGANPATIERESAEAGRRTLIRTVEELTEVRIDHYAEVNLLGFYNLTKAIGGVEVCLREPVDEPKSGADFEAGRQTISGADALAFVRQRYELPDSDFSRIRRQQVFLAAVANKILSAGTLTNPSKLQALIEVAKQSVVLDAGWDILSFARQASDIAGGNIRFLTIPTVGQDSNSAGDVVLVDPDQVARFVHEQTGQPWSGPAPESPDDAAPDTLVAPELVTVDVFNGTEQSGLAGGLAETLTELGYQQGEVGNADLLETTSVHYPPGDSEAAEQVADVLGGVDTEQDSSVPEGSVAVYLGEDFSPEDVDTSAGASAQESTSSTPSPSAAPGPPPPPITAGGVPCVY